MQNGGLAITASKTNPPAPADGSSITREPIKNIYYNCNDGCSSSCIFVPVKQQQHITKNPPASTSGCFRVTFWPYSWGFGILTKVLPL
jgi:hypothetical protein